MFSTGPLPSVALRTLGLGKILENPWFRWGENGEKKIHQVRLSVLS
jgi:hypothetical protein